ncbi:surfeit locus protein 4 homolog [Drosophila madeirensis]|uniref:Surfeit locus protein 4 homolog n=1 Tax=Drosophila madeirensis TaxID=30013 RepID=A0AAU9F4K1_DROMD
MKIIFASFCIPGSEKRNGREKSVCISDMEVWTDWLTRAEDLGDEVVRRSRLVLPTVARLCLVATFFEDALRMWCQWGDQIYFLQLHLNFSWGVAFLSCQVNLLGQLVGCGLVLFRVWTNVAVTLLVGLVLFQLHVYSVPLQLEQLLRNFSLLGGLLLLLVEANEAASCCRIYGARAGLPLLEERRRSQHLMQLTGRILLALMYLTVLQQYFGLAAVVLNSFGLLLMTLILLGYRTRPAALLLAIILSIWNMSVNAWWFAEGLERDFLKYNCFHTLSVVGGLLMVVVLGPGEVSLEQYKKHW